MTDRLAQALARGMLVLDAGLGTRLIALGLDLAQDDPAFWNESRSDAVRLLHQRDVAAGAEAVVANTFGANRAWLGRWDRAGEVERLNRAALRIVREAAGPRLLVLGSVGPTAVLDAGAVREQTTFLTEGGADALLFETYSFDQAVLALREIKGGASLPILVSLVVWPEPIGDHAHRLEDLGASVLGVNCQLGMSAALALVELLSRATRLPLLAKPGVGPPGEAPESPQSFARAVPKLIECGVRLVGGCCGTTDAHVAALRVACYDRSAPRAPSGGTDPSRRVRS